MTRKAVSLTGSGAREPYRHILSSDSDDHARQFRGWDHELRQLAPGPFSGRIQEAHIGDICIQRETVENAVEQIGIVPRGSVTFMLFAPHGDQCYMDGIRLGNDLISVGGVHELNIVSRGLSDAISITLPADVLAEFAPENVDRHAIEHLEGRKRIWRPAHLALARLRGISLGILSTLESDAACLSSELLQDNVHEEIIAALSEVAFSDYPLRVETITSTTRTFLVERVCAYVRSHIDETITIGQLCAEAHVSRRTLQYCFEDVLKISPSHYLLAVRLNAVRRDLRRSRRSTSVQEAASRWGFWHMGRFAAQYKAFFGELPSRTHRATNPRKRIRTDRGG